MKIVKSFEESGLFLKVVNETMKMKQVISRLLGVLSASLLGINRQRSAS